MFRLYGPLAAWGEIAVGEQRPSATHPGKSAVLGVLAAALGVRRDEEARHQEIAEAYGFAVRVDHPGELLRDYHTTQVPPAKGKRRFFTRREELAVDDLYTILSQRDYRMDALYTFALWQRITDAPYSLSALKDALQRPRFSLYLGRKSCVLAVPMQVQIVQADSLRGAFDAVKFEDALLEGLPVDGEISYIWEQHPNPGMEPLQRYPRRDEPLSRKRWQFTERDEYYRGEEHKKEG